MSHGVEAAGDMWLAHEGPLRGGGGWGVEGRGVKHGGKDKTAGGGVKKSRGVEQEQEQGQGPPTMPMSTASPPPLTMPMCSAAARDRVSPKMEAMAPGVPAHSATSATGGEAYLRRWAGGGADSAGEGDESQDGSQGGPAEAYSAAEGGESQEGRPREAKQPQG